MRRILETALLSTAFGLMLSGHGCSCSEEDSPAPLPLDERLSAGQVRAGRVTKETELIGGLTAKGRIGDYKIYNDRITVIVGQVGTSVGFHPYGGIVLDADTVREEGAPGRSAFGEALVAFDFLVLRPEQIEVVNDGRDGAEARIRVAGIEDLLPLFDALLGSILPSAEHEIDWSVDYVLEPGSQWLRIEHTLFNRGHEPVELGPLAGFFFGTGARPFIEGFGFSSSNSAASSDYYGAVGPDVSYIYGRPGSEISIIFGESGLAVATIGDAIKMRARERVSFTEHLVVGDANLSRTQAFWRAVAEGGPSAEVTGRVIDASGAGVEHARVHVTLAAPSIPDRDYVTKTHTDKNGDFELILQPGTYFLVASTDARLLTEPVEISVEEGKTTTVPELSLPTTGVLRYEIRDENDLVPAKLSIRAEVPTSSLLPGRFGEPDHPPGLFRAVFAHTGTGQVDLPSGDYSVFVSRGGEYEIATSSITMRTGEETNLSASITRSVPTVGWMSSDPHIHARLSSDSPDAYPFKVRAMVAENIELPVSTEHEAIGDFNPAIRELGLESRMKGVVGTEISTTQYGHFNAFPMEQDFTKPGNGRIIWYRKTPAETFAAARAAGDPFLQVNHPRSNTIGYFAIEDFDRGTFAAKEDFSLDFDGIEVINGCGDGSIQRAELQDWFAFLNRGLRRSATGALDDHRAGLSQMGYPITYVRMPTDDPNAADIEDFRQAFKAGRLVVSCGPFVEVTVQGAEIGDTVPVSGDLIRLDARVAAPSWMDVDELSVIVDGRVEKVISLETTNVVRFSGTITASVAEGRDGWVLIWASGDQRHGIWAQNRPSFAFSNPIFLDGDGDGRWGSP